MCKFNYRYADRRRDKQCETEIVRQLTTSSSVSERQEYNLCHSWTFMTRFQPQHSLETAANVICVGFGIVLTKKRNVSNQVAATRSYQNNQTAATFDLPKNQCNLIYELSILGALKCVKFIIMATFKILKIIVLFYTNFAKVYFTWAPFKYMYIAHVCFVAPKAAKLPSLVLGMFSWHSDTDHLRVGCVPTRREPIKHSEPFKGCSSLQ